MDQDRLREITQVLETGSEEEREFVLIELREENASLKRRNEEWGRDLMQPSPGSKRVTAQLNPQDLVRKRLELLINFIMPQGGEMEGTRLMFEIRFQKLLSDLHKKLEDAAIQEYARQTKPKLEVPGRNSIHKG